MPTQIRMPRWNKRMKAIISNSNKSLRNVGERRDDANAQAAKRKQYTSTAPAHSKFQFQLPQHAIRIAFFLVNNLICKTCWLLKELIVVKTLESQLLVE